MCALFSRIDDYYYYYYYSETSFSFLSLSLPLWMKYWFLCKFMYLICFWSSKIHTRRQNQKWMSLAKKKYDNKHWNCTFQVHWTLYSYCYCYYWCCVVCLCFTFSFHPAVVVVDVVFFCVFSCFVASLRFLTHHKTTYNI